MKDKVTYTRKCMRCNQLEDYQMREMGEWSQTNPQLSDSGIFKIIADKVKDPYTSDWCDRCQMHTLQMTVGWDYMETS